MRSSQWFILGMFCILMMLWFIRLDSNWNASCDEFDGSSEVTKMDIVACVNSEITDPLIYLLFPLGIIFLIFGWIEDFAERKKKRK